MGTLFEGLPFPGIQELPLTQATGPPHSVWGGGNLYVEGEPRTNRKFNVD